MSHDGFHPPLQLVRGDQLSTSTAQSSGMQRFEAISGATVGSERLWMGRAHVQPSTASGNHHHGEAETAIYVVSGSPEFVFLDPETGEESRLQTAPGDFVFVPPYTPHREENNSPDTEAVCVISRTTQEAISVELSSLDPQVSA
jgi:uncharacterized RmlC-like cupin family protein